MHSASLLAIIAIGIASNLDNAGVGIAYGVRNIKITSWANLIIAFISLAATFISGYAGAVIAQFIPPLAANIVGTAVIVSVGVWVLCQPWVDKKQEANPPTNRVAIILRHPEKADADGSKTISLRESIVLGIALAMNAFAGGFDAGMTQLNVIWTSLSVGAFSYVLLGSATLLGRRFAADALGERATIVAGVLLILVGLHQMF